MINQASERNQNRLPHALLVNKGLHKVGEDFAIKLTSTKTLLNYSRSPHDDLRDQGQSNDPFSDNRCINWFTKMRCTVKQLITSLEPPCPI